MDEEKITPVPSGGRRIDGCVCCDPDCGEMKRKVSELKKKIRKRHTMSWGMNSSDILSIIDEVFGE